MPTEKLPRMSLSEKLDKLQMPSEVFMFYCNLFIRNWTRYCRRNIGGDWFLVKNKQGRLVPLTKDVIANHLLGKFWIATFPQKIARYICFDVDQSAEQMAIYRVLMEWFRVPLIFRSSSNHGLHLYCYLACDFHITVQKLINITKIELLKRGVEARPGICEIFPDPTKPLRLPLGKDSFLLDPQTLQPFSADLTESIRLIGESIIPQTFQDLFPGLWKKKNEK